jgi:hypothetical protein
MHPQRYYIFTQRGLRDLYPGGIADVNDAIAYARLHCQGGPRRDAMILDTTGTQHGIFRTGFRRKPQQ